MAHLNSVFSSKSTFRAIAVLSLGAVAILTPSARAFSPEEVDAAVDKMVGFLKSSQNKDGNWETGKRPKGAGEGGPDEAARWGGETAIATYALCAVGEDQSSEVKKAVDWLENEDLHGTYAVGLRSQIWPYIKPVNQKEPFMNIRKRDVDFVLLSRIVRGPHKGFYGYSYGKTGGGSLGALKFPPMDPRGPLEGAWFDRSNSQYGVLGAWALEQSGAEIPQKYWAEEDEAWKKAQLVDGGWNYNNDGENSASTYTMTSAGIATLFITQDYMLREGHKFEKCDGGVTNSNIERGLAWMDKHISQAISQGGGFYYYGLYGIERIGVASGRKYFGTIDWYQRGAEMILKGQGPGGGFGSIHDTCFALIFLVRGRAPVMMNKLIYENATKKQVDPWNERPRDSANLAHWMGHHSVESFFNWQVVNLKVSVDELHDAPILYIAGSEELSLSNQEIDKLRLYVEQGGMILGNADCGSRAFNTSFQALGNKLFKKYEWRQLPKNHPIYSEQFLGSKWKLHPVVYGLSNGVRELMIHIPEADPARAWQTEATKTREESFQLAGNIFLYAGGKENIQRKGATYIVQAEGDAGREIKVARIESDGNWDPEPGAWRRLAAIMHNENHVGIVAEPAKLTAGALDGYKIAHWTGTAKVILTADQRKELKKFVTGGGFLIIDAAGGSTEFAESAENELKQMFGEEAANGLSKPLPATHPALVDFKKTEQKVFRNYARHLLTGSLREPRIRGIMVANRMAVFFSREDLSGGMVGEPVDGVVGYEPKAATQLMQHLVLYAEAGGKAPTVAAGDAPLPVPNFGADNKADKAPAAPDK